MTRDDARLMLAGPKRKMDSAKMRYQRATRSGRRFRCRGRAIIRGFKGTGEDGWCARPFLMKECVLGHTCDASFNLV